MSATEDGLTTDSEISAVEEGLVLASGLDFSLGFGFGFDSDTNNSIDDDQFGQ